MRTHLASATCANQNAKLAGLLVRSPCKLSVAGTSQLKHRRKDLFVGGVTVSRPDSAHDNCAENEFYWTVCEEKNKESNESATSRPGAPGLHHKKLFKRINPIATRR